MVSSKCRLTQIALVKVCGTLDTTQTSKRGSDGAKLKLANIARHLSLRHSLENTVNA